MIGGVEAGIIYLLIERSDDTHTYYPYELLIIGCKEVLQVGREVI